MSKQIHDIQSKIIPILKQHQVIRAGLFGSLVRDDMSQGSDIDILIELPADQSLFDLVSLKLDLEDSLKHTVDLVEYPMLHPLLSERILQEEVKVL
jgi:predicted nucleotidyltransferase